MATEVRTAFERNGYVVMPAVLDPDEVVRYTSMVDALYERHTTVDACGSRDALHLLGAVHACPALAPLVAHPRVLGPVWSILGWNVHVYHSHVDVHPPAIADPYRSRWHQDGGRQNVELESDARPRLSVKAAYWLSDVSRPGRGNLKVVPGSHTTPHIDRPPRVEIPWPEPPGAIEVLARPGDVVLFDRRLWHARSDNRSAIVRKAVFFAFTYRWVRRRDPAPATDPRYTPLQRQLLGLLADTDGDHEWGHDPRGVPLFDILRRSGQLERRPPSATGRAGARSAPSPT